MELIKFKIDGKIVEVEKGTTVLEAARQNNINIPTLCFLEDMNGKKNLRPTRLLPYVCS